MDVNHSIKIDLYDLVREISSNREMARPFLSENGRNAKQEIAKGVASLLDHDDLQKTMPWVAGALSELTGKSLDGKYAFFDLRATRDTLDDVLGIMAERAEGREALPGTSDAEIAKVASFLQTAMICAIQRAPEVVETLQDDFVDLDDPEDDDDPIIPEPVTAPEGKVVGHADVVAVKTGTAGMCTVIHVTDDDGIENVVTFTGEGAMAPVNAILAMEGLFPTFAARVGPGGQGLAFSISCRDEDGDEGPGFMDL